MTWITRWFDEIWDIFTQQWSDYCK